MTGLHHPIKLNIHPAEPLWKRAPTQDPNGQPLCDFMMLVPRFSRWPEARQASAIRAIEGELERFSNYIVFADFNIKINLLWISFRPDSGVMMAFVEALQQQLPEAVLIANKAEVVMGANAAKEAKPQARLR